jgi:hypothetical protein
MKKAAQNSVPARSAQETPAELIDALLGSIRNQFCPDLDGIAWKKHVPFCKRVLTYGAAWLNKRGVTLPPERYQAIYQAIFNGIKTHGQTGRVRYWPGYLLRCVQEHFKHHGDDYYQEGKNIRALADRALMGFTRASARAEAPDPVAPMAAAYAILAARKPRRCANKNRPARQPDLFAS